MNAVSAGASSTSAPPSPSRIRFPHRDHAAHHGLRGQLRLLRELRQRLRATIVKQTAQHTRHTQLPAQRERLIAHTRIAQQHSRTPRLVLAKPQERHQARAHPRKPCTLPPHGLIDRARQTRERPLESRRIALLLAAPGAPLGTMKALAASARKRAVGGAGTHMSADNRRTN